MYSQHNFCRLPQHTRTHVSLPLFPEVPNYIGTHSLTYGTVQLKKAVQLAVFCMYKALNSQYLGPKTAMNIRTGHGKDSRTVLRYYFDQSLSTSTNSSLGEMKKLCLY